MLTDYWGTVLQQLEGSSARIHPTAEGRPVWMGILGLTGAGGLTVELASAPDFVLTDTEVAVEVLHKGGVYQFATQAWSDPTHKYLVRLHAPKQMTMVQRRSHPRVNVAGNLVCWVQDGEHIVARPDARALNIGIGGIAFESDVPVSVGAYVFIQFRDGIWGHLGHFEGEVLRAERAGDGQYRMALAFRNMKPKVMGELFELVQGRLQMDTGFLESAAGYLE